MATPSKTAGTSLFALANIPLSGNTVGSAVDVSGKFGGNVYLHFGRRSSSAFTVAPTFRIEGNAKGGGVGFWFPLTQFSPTLGTNLSAQALTTASTAGSNVLPITTTTAFALGDMVYVNDATIGSGEFGRVKSISAGVSLTLEENLNNAHAVTTTIIYKAEMFTANLDFTGVTQLRIVPDNSANSVAGFDLETFLVSLDSIS